MKFILNQNRIIETTVHESTFVLDFLRNIGVKGVKEGCHEGDCGACMVLVGELKDNELVYQAVTSCLLPIGEVKGKHIVTIEGLNYPNKLNLIQQAFVDEGGSQCGFCTPGFIVSLTGYLISGEITKENLVNAMEGNICRCTGYSSIIRAANSVYEKLEKIGEKNTRERIISLIDVEILPPYFEKIAQQLKKLGEKAVSMKKKGILVAGGTDLFVQNRELKNPVFLSQIEKNLLKIWSGDDYIYIGALANVEKIRNSEALNQIVDAKNDLARVSALSIRNRATIGGNIVNASPIGDLTIYFLALDADICLSRNGEQRIIKLRNFFKDYKIVDMKEGEIVKWIRVRKEKKLFNFEKVAKRNRMDIASVNSAISLNFEDNKLSDVHISAGGVNPIPTYLTKTTTFLEGKELSADIIKEAVKIADTEIVPIDDVRGSANYKRLLLRQLLYAHFVELFNMEGLI